MLRVKDPSVEPRVSKTRRKRDMHALQDLGTELAALTREQLDKLDLPEALRQAVHAVHAIAHSKHEARRRQLQYIGRLMRDVDPAPLRTAVDTLQGRSRAAIGQQHRLERLRASLLEDERALAEIAKTFPTADLQRLRTLRRNALVEQEQGRAPRAFRELFRVLRTLADAESRDEPHIGRTNGQ